MRQRKKVDGLGVEVMSHDRYEGMKREQSPDSSQNQNTDQNIYFAFRRDNQSSPIQPLCTLIYLLFVIFQVSTHIYEMRGIGG